MTQPPSPDPARRSRDRDATTRAILDAAMDVLAQDGFQGFGVNAVARRAGCDKQLIYRYYGGLEGLLEAVGARVAEALAAGLKPLDPPPRSYGDLASGLAIALLRLLRSDDVLRQVIAWELAAPGPLAAPFAAARARVLGQWMQTMRGDLAAPADIDVAARNALAIAAVQQIALAAAGAGAFAGVPLRTAADWARIEAALSEMIRASFTTA